MNSDIIQGNWKEIKGKIQEHWGKFTDDDLEIIAGRRDQLIGMVQREYGKSRDLAEKEVDHYLKTIQ